MRLRALVKTAAAEALCRTGADRVWNALSPGASLVLGYHRVVEDADRAARGSIPAMVVSARTLERHLDWVGRRFRFVSLDELAGALESGPRGGRAPAAVTFDDGYRDVYEHAFPLLQRKGIPGAVFVVTDLLGTSRRMIHDRLYLALARTLVPPLDGRARLARRLRILDLRVPALEDVTARAISDAFGATRALLEALPAAELDRVTQALEHEAGLAGATFPEQEALDWDMVLTMHREGFTIGSHTCSHVLLTNEEPGRVRQELVASRQQLESRLGAPVRHLAYPDGRFDHAVVGEAAAAGYQFAYTTCRHRDRARPLLTIPRQLWWERSGVDAFGRPSPAIMSCQAHGAFDVAARCGQDHGSRAAATA